MQRLVRVEIGITPRGLHGGKRPRSAKKNGAIDGT